MIEVQTLNPKLLHWKTSYSLLNILLVTLNTVYVSSGWNLLSLCTTTKGIFIILVVVVVAVCVCFLEATEHTYGGLQQWKFVFSHSGRPEVKTKVPVSRVGSFWGCEGKSGPGPFLASWLWLPVVPRVPWLIDTSLQAFPQSHVAFALCIPLCLFL